MTRACVDTNVLLRFLTGDPPDLAAQARALMEAVDRGEVTLVVDDLVVAELVWVLQSFYGRPAPAIARVVQELLSHEGLQAEDKAGLLTALSLFADKNVDFTDALLAVRMGRRGVREIYSFDRHFEHLPGLVRRTPGV